jgi:protoporphyrin/coproporphyrin ferrochelatase
MASETMPTYRSTPQLEPGLPESTGVLVINLGTPDAPTTGAVRRFLRQFLSDPHVIQYPRVLWWLILNLVILVIRPSRSAAAYRKIWAEKGSPLLVHSEAITNKLRECMVSADAAPVHVELAMTYGEPSIAKALDKLFAKGVSRIVTLPLYPQYSRTTTAAAIDAVASELKRQGQEPASRSIDSYHDAPGYISALAASVREYWVQNGRGEILLLSFHGVPKSTLLDGDPYQRQCQETASLLADQLELDDDDWLLSFQSRVGREEWLAPYTDETVRELGGQGLALIDVVCPGFSTDCLETLEEIAMQNAGFFKDAGGESLRYIPALNARDDHVRFLADLLQQRIKCWSVGAAA